MNTSPHSSFLNLLLIEKGLASVSTSIVQDNAKQLSLQVRRPLRAHSSPVIPMRHSRWGRTDSDSSLVKPTRCDRSKLPRQSGRVKSDISLFLPSKSQTRKTRTFQPSLASLESPTRANRKRNAAWDQFDFQANESQASMKLKSSLFCPLVPLSSGEFSSSSRADRWASESDTSSGSWAQTNKSQYQNSLLENRTDLDCSTPMIYPPAEFVDTTISSPTSVGMLQHTDFPILQDRWSTEHSPQWVPKKPTSRIFESWSWHSWLMIQTWTIFRTKV